MKASFKKLTHGIVALSLLWISGAVHAGDILPWPVGTECPFPWATIEGDWVAADGLPGHVFHFSIERTLKDGSRVLEILHYDSSGDLIGWGRGVSSKGEKMVRMLMEYVSREYQGAYWGTVRTYPQSGGVGLKSCRSRTSKTTVFSMAPVDKGLQGQEIHVVIEKTAAKSRNRR